MNRIEAYLEHLSVELGRLGVLDIRFAEEARGHLVDAVEQRVQNGMDIESAERETIAQFGSARSVAQAFVTDKYRWFDRMVWVAAAVLGSTIAFVDASSNWDDSGVTAFAFVASAAMCGFIAPRWPWRWALAVGVWIPLLAVARSASFHSLAMLLVLLFPFAGAYAGTSARRSLLLRAVWRRHPGGDFHDKNGFIFGVMTRPGQIDPELAAILADPDTKLVPFLERTAPSALGPLGGAQSISDTSESAAARVRKYQVVFGVDRKITCRVEIGAARKVTIHWSRTDWASDRS